MSNSSFDSQATHSQLDPFAILKGLVGAVLGAVLGYFAFVKLSSMGLYAFMLPGALVGLGCGLLAKSRSVVLAILCCLIAVVASVIGEWQTLWFTDENGDDRGLAYFVQNIHKSRGGFAVIAVALNGAIAAWFGRRG